jgi:fructose-bisphosphate aldolase class 1
LAELIFDKRNEAFNSGKCPERFWTTDSKLHGAYKGQVIAAAKLLKNYHADSIIKALKSPEAKYIFKIQDKKLIPIIEKFEKNRVDRQLDQSYNTTEEVAKPFRSKKKNVLKDL